MTASRTTEQRLLDATLDVVREKGIGAATSREITVTAGVNLAAITYHFGSKDALVAQALLRAVRAWLEPARATLQTAGDPANRLLGTLQHLRESLREARRDLPAYFEALAAAPRSEELRSQVAELFAELKAVLSTEISEMKANGYVASWVDPEAMAALIVAAGDGFALHVMLDPAGIDTNAALDQVIHLLLAARADQ